MNQTTHELDEMNDDDLPSFLRSDTAQSKQEKAPENFQQPPFLLKENMHHLKALKELEDTEMLFCYKRIIDTIQTKCRRCDSRHGCLGCVFSEGEMLYYLKTCLQLMDKQDHKICLKAFDMDESKWKDFIDTE